MTAKEFEKEKEQIEVDYKNKKQELYEKYALSNNPYKIGDIIKDHYHTIRVEKIRHAVIYFNTIMCLFWYTIKKGFNT